MQVDNDNGYAQLCKKKFVLGPGYAHVQCMDATALTHSSPAFSIKVAVFLIIFTKKEQKRNRASA